MNKSLLSRDKFREGVFSRDNYKCVVCNKNAVDAHHILERRLFSDGGYYLNNGSSLCENCHLKAEMTLISVEDIRKFSNILEKDKIIPEHLYRDQIYDKWGNPILSSGKRLRGELFEDISVQKILKEGNVLDLFCKYVKYPRTYHLPWSKGITDDDRVSKNLEYFSNKNVVVTLKMDGENTTLYNDYIHARSLSNKKHWSKNWIKNFHSKISHDIPENMRFVVENLYAKHSISYSNLENYVYGISIWTNLKCLSWKDTQEWFALFNIPTVQPIYEGLWYEKKIKILCENLNSEEHEGCVVRLSDEFSYKDFSSSVAKYVRANHVTSNEHWFHGNGREINKLKVQENT